MEWRGTAGNRVGRDAIALEDGDDVFEGGVVGMVQRAGNVVIARFDAEFLGACAKCVRHVPIIAAEVPGPRPSPVCVAVRVSRPTRTVTQT